ncbi:hypothetical protein GHT07_12315 [Caenimonas koreensis DSM 17982]|uniref:Uncharacterized protein n=1 Tax=Caenimonas koreensis DSM 17982 TaxID=1121255 RepID=A0A844B9B7_9BURK|nr:hypothetical protein [Caenimonas koreensis]MRD48067.1 hypothetical protein [Caenimonas koreensis DSM 17982]
MSDIGFTVAMAVASVAALAIVAPRFFEGKQDGADFSEEIEALHKQSDGQVKKRKWE